MFPQNLLAEGRRFELLTQLSSGKRLAGARTRPLCDPSAKKTRQRIVERPHLYYHTNQICSITAFPLNLLYLPTMSIIHLRILKK